MIFLAQVVDIVATILIYCLLARAVLSWFVVSGQRGYGYGARQQSPLLRIYQVLGSVTEPIVRPVRRLLSRFNTGPVDFSPMAAMLLIIVVRRLLIWLLLLPYTA